MKYRLWKFLNKVVGIVDNWLSGWYTREEKDKRLLKNIFK